MALLSNRASARLLFQGPSSRIWTLRTTRHIHAARWNERKSSSLAPPLGVSDSDIVRLASRPLHPLSLSELVKHGRPPLSQRALLDSARFTLSLLPTRLAHRLHAIRNLPYIVVSNPHISQIYRNYMHSLSTLLPFQQAGIYNADDEAAFTDVLAELVQTHANTIPTLARGLRECGRYLGDGEGRIGGKFLDQHLRARIGTRLVAEQHIALHLASNPLPLQDGENLGQLELKNFVGIIDTALSPVAVIRQCEFFVGELCELKYGVRPTVDIAGDVEARITHIPTHLEYVLTELLKNAFRATIEQGHEREAIEITIALGGEENLDSPSLLHTLPIASQGEAPITVAPSTTSLTIRIRDRGGGIPPEVLPQIWDYSFTTFDNDTDGGGLATLSASGTDGSTIAGLGYGLPLGRAYADFFGGDLNIESLWHWGTDAYLRVKGLETSLQ